MMMLTSALLIWCVALVEAVRDTKVGGVEQDASQPEIDPCIGTVMAWAKKSLPVDASEEVIHAEIVLFSKLEEAVRIKEKKLAEWEESHAKTPQRGVKVDKRMLEVSNTLSKVYQHDSAELLSVVQKQQTISKSSRTTKSSSQSSSKSSKSTRREASKWSTQYQDIMERRSKEAASEASKVDATFLTGMQPTSSSSSGTSGVSKQSATAASSRKASVASSSGIAPSKLQTYDIGESQSEVATRISEATATWMADSQFDDPIVVQNKAEMAKIDSEMLSQLEKDSLKQAASQISSSRSSRASSASGGGKSTSGSKSPSPASQSAAEKEKEAVLTKTELKTVATIVDKSVNDVLEFELEQYKERRIASSNKQMGESQRKVELASANLAGANHLQSFMVENPRISVTDHSKMFDFSAKGDSQVVKDMNVKNPTSKICVVDELRTRLHFKTDKPLLNNDDGIVEKTVEDIKARMKEEKAKGEAIGKLTKFLFCLHVGTTAHDGVENRMVRVKTKSGKELKMSFMEARQHYLEGALTSRIPDLEVGDKFSHYDTTHFADAIMLVYTGDKAPTCSRDDLLDIPDPILPPLPRD